MNFLSHVKRTFEKHAVLVIFLVLLICAIYVINSFSNSIQSYQDVFQTRLAIAESNQKRFQEYQAEVKEFSEISDLNSKVANLFTFCSSLDTECTASVMLLKPDNISHDKWSLAVTNFHRTIVTRFSDIK